MFSLTSLLWKIVIWNNNAGEYKFTQFVYNEVFKNNAT